MNASVETPPPQKGMGCFARGCLALVIFAGVLLMASVVALYWGARNYSLFHRGLFWLLETNTVSKTAVSIPKFKQADSEIEGAQERWEKFDQAVHRNQPAEIELTAEDINALISSNRVFASIDGNRLRLLACFPMRSHFGSATHYWNFDVEIAAEGPLSLDHPQLEHIIVNGRRLPNDLLEWTWHSRRVRDFISESREANRAGSIQIHDGKLILKSRTN